MVKSTSRCNQWKDQKRLCQRYLANYVQSVFNTLLEEKVPVQGGTLVVSGDGRFWNPEAGRKAVMGQSVNPSGCSRFLSILMKFIISFWHVAYLLCFLNLCPSSAWAVSDLDVSQRPFRSLSRWLSLQEWHVYGVAPMDFYPRQPPLPWFECGEEKAMNLLEVWGSWCQISSHPFTETCTTSSVFTLVPLCSALPELFFSSFSTYNIPTCNPRLFGFWHALASCMSPYCTHMFRNTFPQITHIPLNKSCLNCGSMHLI